MKVALYARVSTDDQAERGTVGAQVDFFRRWCELHDHPPGGEYIDEGISGTVAFASRPAGARLLADAARGAFEEVALFRLDRLARDTSVALDAVKLLDALRVRLISMTEPFDTATASGKLMLDILASFAGYERNAIHERASEGRRKKATAGGWLGGKVAPYGYRIEGTGGSSRLVPDDTPEPAFGGVSRAEIVRWAYGEVSSGARTASAVASYFTAIGLPTSTGKSGRWAKEHIVRMIRRSVYRGVQVRGEENARSNLRGMETPCPALVDEKTWEAAIERLVYNRRFSRTDPARYYILRGLMVCAHCGGSYTGFMRAGWKERLNETSGNGTLYRCHRHAAGRGCPGDPKAIDGTIEDFVWDECVAWLRAPETVEGRVADAQAARKKDQGDAPSAERERLAAARGRKESERQAVLKLYRQGAITEDDRAAQFADIAAETAVLDTEIARIDDAARIDRESAVVIADTVANVRAIAEANLANIGSSTREQRRAIIELLVRRVVVTTEATGKVYARSGRIERAVDAALFFRFAECTGVTAVPTAVTPVHLCMARWGS